MIIAPLPQGGRENHLRRVSVHTRACTHAHTCAPQAFGTLPETATQQVPSNVRYPYYHLSSYIYQNKIVWRMSFCNLFYPVSGRDLTSSAFSFCAIPHALLFGYTFPPPTPGRWEIKQPTPYCQIPRLFLAFHCANTEGVIQVPASKFYHVLLIFY